jgi:hypothetical protein
VNFFTFSTSKDKFTPCKGHSESSIIHFFTLARTKFLTYLLLADAATVHGLEGRDSIHGMGKRFSLPHRVQSGFGTHKWVPMDFFFGIKRPGREADNLPPSSAKIKNG